MQYIFVTLADTRSHRVIDVSSYNLIAESILKQWRDPNTVIWEVFYAQRCKSDTCLDLGTKISAKRILDIEMQI